MKSNENNVQDLYDLNFSDVQKEESRHEKNDSVTVTPMLFCC